MKKDTIEFSGGEMSLILRDVLLVKYRTDREITEDDMQDQRNKREQLVGKLRHYPIVDLSEGIVNFSDEAKAWAAVNKKSSSMRICDIIVVKGAVMKFKVRFYTLMYKPANKTVVLTSIEDAMDYIQKDRKIRMAKLAKSSS